MLKSTATSESHVAVLELKGEATEELGGLLPGLDDLLQRGQLAQIWDFTEVSYVNSAGLSRCVESYRAAIRKDVKVALCGLQPHVLKIFKLARVEIFIPIYESRALAFKHFGVMVKENTGPPREQILVISAGMELGDGINRMLSDQKEQLNYRFSHAPDLREGLKFLQMRGTQLIVLDVNVAQADAEQFLAAIRTNPTLRPITIIIATPDSKITDADYLIRNGADDMLRLPLSAYEASCRLRTGLALHYALSKDDEQLSRFAPSHVVRGASPTSKYPVLR